MKGLVNKTGGDRYMAGTTKGKRSEGMTDKRTNRRSFHKTVETNHLWRCSDPNSADGSRFTQTPSDGGPERHLHIKEIPAWCQRR